MDEVLAVGDMAFQKKCLDKMRNAAKEEGRTVLYVSHNMNTIRQLCDRCIVLDAGKLIYDGDVEKAISIYMDSSLGENQVDMDLETKSHSLRDLDTGLRMKHLKLEGKQIPVYHPEEDLLLHLRVGITAPISAAAFRLTLRTDADVGLGTAWSEELAFGETGDREITLSMPLRGIAKGSFYASIGFYRFDELGRSIMLDHITRAFKLEVEGQPVWDTTAHGYVHLPEIHEVT